MSLSVLVLEDEPLIALDIEETLRSSGFDVSAVLNSCGAAEEWLAASSPDVAILDIRLRDGACESVAKNLADRSIPFIVHSGSEQSWEQHHPVFREGIWVTKPALPEVLIAALQDSVKRKS